MYCRICGDEDRVKFYPAKRQSLCPHCAKDTPANVGREAFDAKYWATGDDVPQAIRRDFYEDYLASRHSSVAKYLEATTSYH